jgi:hypothetical protein
MRLSKNPPPVQECYRQATPKSTHAALWRASLDMSRAVFDGQETLAQAYPGLDFLKSRSVTISAGVLRVSK